MISGVGPFSVGFLFFARRSFRLLEEKRAAAPEVKRMYTVVLWDVEGTLVDYAMPVESFVHRCLARAGVPADALAPGAIEQAEEVRAQLEPLWRTAADEDAGCHTIAKVLLQGSGATEDQLRAVARLLGEYFELFTLVPGIRGILEELDAAGLVQGVVSNWPPSLKSFLDFHGLSRYFKVVVGSGEFGAAKPDHAIFRHALRRLGVPASECIFVGDNLHNDIIPARSLGMHAIHFDPLRRWAKADARDAEQLRSLLWERLRTPA